MDSIITSFSGPPETKACGKCGLQKPLKLFGIQIHTEDGRNAHCLDCDAANRQLGISIKARRGGDKSLKTRARNALNRAVAAGTMIRAGECLHCHAKAETEAHHYLGYEPAFWLEVQWLCTECHGRVHARRANRNWAKGWEGAA